MPFAPASGHPVRVIYAKLTSTGAYDVVARTSNIPLDDARTLAERLLPGNPPLDATIGEEVAHLRPPEGGHIVWRFARYGWADGNRGDVYITDIAWYSDADFDLARGDAFVLVPRTDELFAERAELPPFAVAPLDGSGERARRASLQERVGADARTVIAGAAAAEPVLLIHEGARAPALELFTLLLPPALRAGLTFQSQAFRVPPVLPRLTLADRGYANLRDGPWQVLPSLDVAVPLELAGRLVALAGQPDALELAHALYEDAGGGAPGLRGCIARVVALAEVAAPLLAGDVAATLRAVAPLEPGLRVAALRRLRTRAGAAAVTAALAELERESAQGSRLALELLPELGELPAEGVAALVDALRADAPAALLGELAVRCTRAGDLARVIRLLALDHRTVSSRLAAAGGELDPDVRRLTAAVQAGSAPDLLLAGAAVHPRLREGAARESLQRMCRDAMADALEAVQPNAHGIESCVRLAAAADAYVAVAGTSSSLPPAMAEYELAQPGAASRAVAVHGLPARAALGGALLVRACAAHSSGNGGEAGRLTGGAVTLLGAAERAQLEQVRQGLAEGGIREQELIALPGADALLPLLGGNVQQAGLTRRIVAAIEAVAGGRESGVAELAAAVVLAHGQRMRITAGGDLSRGVLAALRGLGARPGESTAAAAEVCLELLAVITDAGHLPELEEAALGDRMSVRLQRLDRSIAHCRAVEREDLYERYADAIESPDVPLNGTVRERLREALGTRGLQRRLLRAVASVMARDAV